MNIKYVVLMNILFLCLSFAILCGASYSMGEHKFDKSSEDYKNAHSFFIVGACLSSFFVVLLLVFCYLYIRVADQAV